jgi:chemotaxis protein methyltransferase CheR
VSTRAADYDLTTEEFQKLRDFFYEKTGMFFEDVKRYFVARRASERMRAVGTSDFRSYFSLLRFEPSAGELQQLVNLMTVNETYFFREEYQLQCLVRSILPEVARRRTAGRHIRIWSVPCSTGEEAYSVAIYLLEQWPKLGDFDVELVASDIDTTVLEAARRGVYGDRAVAPLPQRYLQKYFTAEARGVHRITDELSSAIDFCPANLHDAESSRRFRDFDVIFCRNMLIYFDDLSRRKAADILFDALAPGGFLCLGHSESMSRISPLFEIRKFPDAIVYQKPVRG